MITNGPGFVTIGMKRKANSERELRTMDVSKAIVEKMQHIRDADTTGAGDNFTGGVLYSIANQLMEDKHDPDLEEACIWGIVSGGFACTYMGGTYQEDQEGEKLDAIRKLYDRYRRQLHKPER